MSLPRIKTPGTSRTTSWRRRRDVKLALQRLLTNEPGTSASQPSELPINMSIGSSMDFTDSETCIRTIDNSAAEETADVTVATLQSSPQWTGNVRVDFRTLMGSTTMCTTDQGKVLSMFGYYFHNLPKDIRTIMETPRSTVKKQLDNGIYVHFGLEKKLTSMLNDWDHHEAVIHLQLHIDGMTLFRDSVNHAWPIQCRICYPKMYLPFAVGVFSGSGKPQPIDAYLEDTLSELSRILVNGICTKWLMNTRVQLCCVICDTPARCYIKGTRSFSAFHGCDKCTDPGTSVGGHVRLLTFDADPRTDDSFRRRLHKRHHGPITSPFEQIPIDMVNLFPSEPMHFIHLGIVKKLVRLWTRCPEYSRSRSPRIRRIGTRIEEVNKCIPSDFPRQCRPIRHYKCWKACESRLFLLYLSFAVLPDLLSKEHLENFLNFSISIYVLYCKRFFSIFFPYVRLWLLRFVQQYRNLYGPQNVTYNMHTAVHVCDDVERLGMLDHFEAFAFESNLGKLRRKVHGPREAAVQLYRRFAEMEGTRVIPAVETENVSITMRRVRKSATHFVHNGTVFTDAEPDCFAIIRNEPVQITRIEGSKVHYKTFLQKEDLFNYCLPSSYLFIFVVKEVSDLTEVASISDIMCKCFLLRTEARNVIMPLIHTW